MKSYAKNSMQRFADVVLMLVDTARAYFVQLTGNTAGCAA